MIYNFRTLRFPFDIIIFFIFVFFLLFKYEVLSMIKDDIYSDPNVLKIYDQTRVLKNLKLESKEELQKFTQLSATKQHEFLKKFNLIQDDLEKEYKNIKSNLSNKRLVNYGISCVLALAAPFLCIKGLNLFLLESSQISIKMLPFVFLQGSGFFMFKFLDLFNQTHVVSWEGAIRDYEIQYVRNKPLYDKNFCKVFESKLIAAHKNPSNLYDSLKWLSAASSLPIAKKIVSIDQFSLKLEKAFSIFPKEIQSTVNKMCLRHMIQKHTKVMAYFHGPSGTGKTRCAREIARFLGVPFGLIALANYSVSDLVGEGGSYRPHPGKFAETFLNAKDEDDKSYTNMVFLIDEADKILNTKNDNNGLLPFLLTFLDPETESYYNPYFEKNVRIKDALIILSGNEPLQNDSLRKRLINVEFSGFDKKYKKEYIIKEYIPQLYQETDEPYKLEIKKHFSKTDKKKLSQFIEKDNDPGLRSVQEQARQFVDEKILEVFFDDDN